MPAGCAMACVKHEASKFPVDGVKGRHGKLGLVIDEICVGDSPAVDH